MIGIANANMYVVGLRIPPQHMQEAKLRVKFPKIDCLTPRKLELAGKGHERDGTVATAWDAEV